MPRIQYTTSDGATGEVELSGERLTVGRADDNHIIIPDGSVSSHHGEIVFDGANWVFNDLGSTNGTKVGDERVNTVNLGADRAFSLGSVDCVFISDGGGQAAMAPAAEANKPEAPAIARSMTAAGAGGYGSEPYDRSLRKGFGPPKKEKDPKRAMLMTLGFVGLLACGAAVAMFMRMGM